MKKIITILLLITAFYSCERDDICPESTPTTPQLIIRFYDITEQSDTKRVIDLQIHGLDNDDNELELYQSIESTDSIVLPLRTIDNDDDPTNGISTKFKLHKDYEYNDNGTPDDDTDDFEEGNPDIISIQYSAEEIYVSRACGYKTIFNNVEISLETDGDNWIELLQFENPLIIDNETEAHVQIFH